MLPFNTAPYQASQATLRQGGLIRRASTLEVFHLPQGYFQSPSWQEFFLFFKQLKEDSKKLKRFCHQCITSSGGHVNFRE
jgi:hypothetical protein